jgi:hypothetical protein
MPSSNDEEAPFGVPVQENPPRIQEEESEEGEQGPILTRSALKQECNNQPQTTRTQYYNPLEFHLNGITRQFIPHPACVM